MMLHLIPTLVRMAIPPTTPQFKDILLSLYHAGQFLITTCDQRVAPPLPHCPLEGFDIYNILSGF
jgi:hypothetical protein